MSGAYRGTGVDRHRLNGTVIRIVLDPAERTFLLARLADIGASAEALLARLDADQYRAAWGRRAVVNGLRELVSDLRNRDVLWVSNEIARQALREAIEGNPYFSRMAADDPRLNGPAITRADLLRPKLARALALPILAVPLPPR